jgi:ABC-type antimicrobial peptide transport system permease subunit
MLMTELLGSLIVGVMFGLAATIGATRYLETVLFELSPNDPVTLVTVACVMLIVAMLASYLPARRASTR